LAPRQTFEVAEQRRYVSSAQVAGDALHVLGGRVGVAAHRFLVLLPELLARLPDGLRHHTQPVDGPLLLAGQLGGCLLFGLVDYLAGRVLRLLDHLPRGAARLFDEAPWRPVEGVFGWRFAPLGS
jgi:hypothetical protein